MNRRDIITTPISVAETPEVLRDCFNFKTWNPRAIGIFGTPSGKVFVEKLSGKALTLPDRTIKGNHRPVDAFSPTISKDQLTQLNAAVYDMYEPPEGFNRFSNGRLYFVVTGMLPEDTLLDNKGTTSLVPASELGKTLADNYKEHEHVMTKIAIHALNGYLQSRLG